MNSPGRSEYFRREAGEFLRELEPLVGPETPPVAALSRLARGLRGAAMLAGHSSFATAAGELERVLRRLAEGDITWADVGPAVRKAVGDFRELVGSPGRWDQTSDREAVMVTEDLQAVSGGADPTTTRSASWRQADAAGYIGRQNIVAADEVDHAAQAISAGSPTASEITSNARRTLQSLRGLAGLDEYSPLAEIIEATETLFTDMERSRDTGRDGGEILSLAATALRRVARSVADGTPPVPDDPQIVAFADALTSRLALDVVPIDQLIDATTPGAVVVYGGRDKPAHASGMELAGLSDSLRTAAREIRAAPSRTSRRLVALTHAVTLRTVTGGLGRRPAGRIVASAVACLEAGVGGGTHMTPGAAAPILEEAARIIASTPFGGEENAGELESVLDALADRLQGMPHPPPHPPPSGLETIPPVSTVVPIESLLVTDPVPIQSLLASEPIPEERPPSPEPVPIESLLAAEPVPIESLLAATPVPIEELAPTPSDRTQMERSLSTYSQLIQRAAPVAALATLSAEPPRSRQTSADIVAIEQLLYRGRGALERADEVRRHLQETYPATPADLERIEPLFRELLDLLPMALAGDD